MTKRASLSTARKIAIFVTAKGICHLCGGHIHGKPWEVEHVTPLAMGGADDETNMRPAHKACHAPKTAEDVADIARAKRREAKHIGSKPLDVRWLCTTRHREHHLKVDAQEAA